MHAESDFKYTTILVMETYLIDSVWLGRPECRFHLHYPERHGDRSHVDRDKLHYLIHSDSAHVGWSDYLCFRSRLLFYPSCENGFDRKWLEVLHLESNIAWLNWRAFLHLLRWWMIHRKSSTCIPYQALSCYCKTAPRILYILTFVDALSLFRFSFFGVTLY